MVTFCPLATTLKKISTIVNIGQFLCAEKNLKNNVLAVIGFGKFDENEWGQKKKVHSKIIQK